MRLAGLLVALAFLTGAEGAFAFDRHCNDEYGRDLCDPAVREEIRSYFDAPAAEALAREGMEGVRVFLIDGYSHDMPLVSVLKDASGQVRLEARIRSDGGPVILTERGGKAIWAAAGALQAAIATSPERMTQDDTLSICLHAWMVVAESLADGQVTTRLRNACDDDPIFRSAFRLSTVAVNAFDHCNRLFLDQYRNNSARLEQCGVLKGPDRLAAADVQNRIMIWREGEAEADPLAPDVELRTAEGRVAQGPDAVRAALPDDAPERIYVHAIEAEAASARVKGRLGRSEDGKFETAEFVQHWAQGDDGVWRVRRWTLGPFKSRD